MRGPLRQTRRSPQSEGPTSEPVMSPGHSLLSVESRENSHADAGSSSTLSWGARTDVGLVREHNEDSYLVSAPVFAVCDGMGGHASGEIASSIAVDAIAENAPLHADDILLGAAVETANALVIEGAAQGMGRPGMGCTASCALIEGHHMAIAHVGDSRIYLLHNGTLVRLTHDHSYVEELVEAGEITADEARVHPSRSVIIRALGSDPDMYADHFSVNVDLSDRVILCSDGLSSMLEDSEIEGIAVSSATPQAAADHLVSAALGAGGHDNVSVVVVDVLDDGTLEQQRRLHNRIMARAFLGLLLALLGMVLVAAAVQQNSWFVGANGQTVGIYRGVNTKLFGRPLYEIAYTTDIKLEDLPDALVKSLSAGVVVSSEDEAALTVESYRQQVDADKASAIDAAEKATGGTGMDPDNPTPVTHEETVENSAEAEANPTGSDTGTGPDADESEVSD